MSKVASGVSPQASCDRERGAEPAPVGEAVGCLRDHLALGDAVDRFRRHVVGEDGDGASPTVGALLGFEPAAASDAIIAPRPISFEAAHVESSYGLACRKSSAQRVPFSRFQSAAQGLPTTSTPGNWATTSLKPLSRAVRSRRRRPR